MPDLPDTVVLGRYGDILAESLVQLCGPLAEAELEGLLGQVGLVRLEVGAVLYRQGEAGSSLHIVLTGRLQVRTASNGEERILAYPQPGDVVGDMALFAGAPRAASVSAVRDSTLAEVSRAALEDLATRDPAVFSRIARMIILRLNGQEGRIARRSGIRTVMVAPLHDSVEAGSFCRGLRQALLIHGSVLELDSRAIAARFNDGGVGDHGRFLDECENLYDYVILQADNGPSAWSRECYGYADRILLVADAGRPVDKTPLERWLFEGPGRQGAYADVELVLCHPRDAIPTGTRSWLQLRSVSRHCHLRHGCQEDMARLARILTDHAVTVVMAGGGARGFAHLGVLRALRDAGIAVDAVGGTSFGALAATGPARGLENDEVFAEQYRAFMQEEPLADYTVPIVSLIRGERLDQVLQKYLPMDIEDLWLPFFALSSDLTANEARIHDSGPLWRAVRASVSVPGVLPPVLESGHLLVDGGVLNNLPVDVMRERIAGRVIAVDLAVGEDFVFEGEEIPPGTEYLKSRLFPWRQPVAAPTISRVIIKATTLASRKEVANARKSADLYLNPPVAGYDFLDWHSLREIADVGYAYALPLVEDWNRHRGNGRG